MAGTSIRSRGVLPLDDITRRQRRRPQGGLPMTSLSRRSLLGSAAAVTTAALITPHARAAAPASGKQAPGFYRYKVGDFEVTAFNDGYVKVPKLDSFVVNQPLEAIQKTVEEAFIPKDDVRVPFNPLLVNTGSKLVLFDTGFGDVGAPTQGQLLANMAAAGIDPQAVDTVIISHFHGDHISGIRAKAGSLNFPNAEIMVPADEWAWWTNDAET